MHLPSPLPAAATGALARRPRNVPTGWQFSWLLAVLLVLIAPAGLLTPVARAQEAGSVATLAQGVAALPPGDLAWQAVRARAEPLASAQFSPRALGFVVATSGTLLIADDTVTHVDLLAPDEAAFVPAGETQQRSSVTDAAVAYLGVELVAVDAVGAVGAVTDNSTVLEPGQPFPSPGDYRELTLLGGVITDADAFLVPDSGQKNIILVTTGTLAVNKPGAAPTTLLAGESATFSGDLELAGASAEASGFVVAVIGDEVIAPAPVAVAPVAASETPIAEAPDATATTTGPLLSGPTPTSPPPVGTPDTTATDDPGAADASAPDATSGDGVGTITVRSLVCPPGMTAERLLPDQCTLASTPFEATLAGDALPAPLILADAANADGDFTWSDLPLGTYRLAQVVAPAGTTEYTIGGARTSGDPVAGFTIELTADSPTLTLEFYNLTPAP